MSDLDIEGFIRVAPPGAYTIHVTGPQQWANEPEETKGTEYWTLRDVRLFGKSIEPDLMSDNNEIYIFPIPWHRSREEALKRGASYADDHRLRNVWYVPE